MCPIANAIVKTVRPKASDTPNKPIPTSGKVAENTALSQPPSTRQNVPMNSASSFFISVCCSPWYDLNCCSVLFYLRIQFPIVMLFQS